MLSGLIELHPQQLTSGIFYVCYVHFLPFHKNPFLFCQYRKSYALPAHSACICIYAKPRALSFRALF
jgi:hypothetical protein